jgi:DNA repair protein RecN (Recombination protein N)
MLDTLKIRNIALIDSAEIHFKEGLNILSGETGAGKSIILESISLILGSRANTDLIRSNADEASVEGLFQINKLQWLKDRLEDLGLPADEDQLLIRRLVHRSGKHRIYVNGALVNLTTLQALCVGLVDLCGQHEHQSLLRSHTQISLLDRYGGLEGDRRKFSACYQALVENEEKQKTLQKSDPEKLRKQDYLKFQIQELEQLELAPGEEEVLQERKLLLQSAGQRLKGAEQVRSCLEDEESGVLIQLRGVSPKLRTLVQIDANLTETEDRFKRALDELEEVSLKIHRYLTDSQMDPEEIETVLARLSKIAELKRKYQLGYPELVEHLSSLQSDLFALENQEKLLSELTLEFEKTLKASLEIGKGLSKKRKKIAKVLGDSVTAELKDLKMQDAELSVEIQSHENWESFTKYGLDTVQFLIRTNTGEDAKPIGKIASGGELSRMMLAIRRIISEEGGIGVYLFDEIDAGIGGQTAFMVGKKLHSVAQMNQVICITHLPQVASFADHHLSVRKERNDQRTQTSVVELSLADRKKEIARMLGGEKITPKALETAAELISMATS